MLKFSEDSGCTTEASKRRSATAGCLAVAALVGFLLLFTGLGTNLERGLQVLRDQVHRRRASGEVVLVEIDARSLSAFNDWPWPRSLHARAIDELARAGASTIAFDVDFSARSQPAQDAALAHSVASSGTPVVLATFRQASSESGNGVIENLPLQELRAHALLASVNIIPDADGFVRSYPYGVVTGGVLRPSIAAMLANSAGTSDGVFPIDGAIDPTTIPRVSFADLVRGRVAPGLLRGRNILVGATAIEMGDRYPVPGHGALPGALVQLLATETLLQGSIPTDHGPILPFAATIAVLPFVLRGRRNGRCVKALATGATLLLLPLATEILKLGTFEIIPALAALMGGVGLATVIRMIGEVRTARLTDLDTKLPNRRAFDSDTHPPEGAAVVLRIANYGDVAGVLGPENAAELIARVAERLTFAGEGRVYRVDDSTMAWTLSTTDPDEQVSHINAAAVMLRPVFDIAGRLVEISIAFGLADLASDRQGVIDRAAMASDRALLRGLRYDRHSEDIDREGDWRLGIAAELDRAMAAGQIWVAYQPKYDLRARRIVGAEALVRWRHPERKAIAPDDFIPALEENGRIIDLTLYVLERALEDQRRWREAGLDLGVAVNVSALLPADPAFVQRVQDILKESAGQATALTLEVTESATMLDAGRATIALERLAALGVALSIDDYGTGQSTLSYLKRLPAREIKIDKSFVMELDTSRPDQAMVRSTIELAHELGFKVVAEGVKSQAILDLLASYSCDVAQGWHIGRPVTNEEFLRAAQKQAPMAA